MTTLIVDDIAENLYLLVSLLKGDGHQAFSAANGAEALEILHSNPIDLIISDILMPKMDGFQLCKECKSDDNLKKIPFIFYTATYTDYSDEEFALKLGANRFIRKPIDPSEFLAIIRSVLQEVESGKVDTSRKTGIPEEKEILKLYSERLVKKLENKMLELEGEVKKRKKVEEELSKNEEKYRLLTENAAEAIIVVQDSYIKFMNKMAVQRLVIPCRSLLPVHL